MPIPAGAGVIAAVVQFQRGSPIHDPRIAIVWVLLIAGTGFLMVSSWRFWSGKEITSGGRLPFQMVALIALGIAITILFHRWVLMFIALGYLISGVIARVAYSWQRRRRLGTTG
jgi:CDP-diacylglycerol---serine O-phosphatidyltransferase